ncbi:MAG: lactate dehydrogenase [Actinobacteria bacterium]|nr:lactate dehydrogenase [Actinomycetota bacterium]
MDVAIIGAAGACGRQLAAQVLQRGTVPPGGRLQLVGHRGGPSETELWGLRSDLEDAFGDWAPDVELVLDPDAVDADLVVVLAGQTVSLDPNAPVDRAELARVNAALFHTYAVALARRPDPPIVVVQSNPVELGVRIFAEHLPRERVIGAGAWSDTLRFRRELAEDLGLPRRDVAAVTLGEHGDRLVPVWSAVRARGVPADAVDRAIAAARGDRQLVDLPDEIATARTEVVDLIRSGAVAEAWARVGSLPADLRVAVKPFFTNFTSGRTTEAVTAHAVADLLEAFVDGVWRAFPAQVWVRGDWNDLHAAIAIPVIVGQNGWTPVVDLALHDDELDALQRADAVLAARQEELVATLE